MLSQELPLNTPTVVADTKFIRVTAIRTSPELVDFTYRRPVSDEVVLQMTVGADGRSADFKMVDKVFWNITVEGQPATQGDLDKVFKYPKARFEAFPETRHLNFGRSQD